MNEIKFTPPDAESRKNYDVTDSFPSDGLTKKVDNKNLAYAHGDGLCFTCRHHHHFRRGSQNQFMLMCTYFEPAIQVAEDITECNKYSNPLEMGLYEMGQIATLIDIRPTGGHYV